MTSRATAGGPHDQVIARLRQRGVLPATGPVEVQELTGGVSNIVLDVRSDGPRVIVKQALPFLRVAEPWAAKVERLLTEGAALQLAGELQPGLVPAVFDVDAEVTMLCMEHAPEGWLDWKTHLMKGNANPDVAGTLGAALANWHSLSAGREDVARAFDDYEAFEQLRVDPYYRVAAARNPELKPKILDRVEQMLNTQRTLVHGDYSPKNALVGPGPRAWVLDWEVAHYGDPAFDVAFMVNHLLLKRLHVPNASARFTETLRRFWDGYHDRVDPTLVGDPSYVVAHVGCLMLARVDGKSPVEYLSDAERAQVRRAAAEMIRRPATDLDGLIAEAP